MLIKLKGIVVDSKSVMLEFFIALFKVLSSTVFLGSIVYGSGASRLPSSPPAQLYHFGAREPLLRNVQANTLPQADWDTFIMGEQTTWALPPYRRGLYGVSNPKAGERFVDQTVRKGAQPWLIEIQVDPGCLQPQVIFDPAQPLKDSRFSQWLHRQSSGTLDEFKKTCTSPDGRFLGRKYRVSHPNFCENTMNEFLVEGSTRIVKDSAVAESWYIRDRSCITSIRGSPSQLIDILLRQKSSWLDRDFKIQNGTGPDIATSIFLAAVGEIHEATSALMRAQQLIEQILKKEQNLMSETDLELFRILSGWLQALTSCSAQGRLGQAQNSTREFLKRFNLLLVRGPDFGETVALESDYFLRMASNACR